MKRRKLILCICALSFTMMMGCSSKDTIDASKNITVMPEAESNTSEEKLEDTEITLALKDNTEETNTENTEKQLTDELEGEVRTINPTEKFVVVSKIYVDGQTAVAPIEGSDDEELVTIYFTDDAKYILETGKSDGTDVKQEEADFSKIEIGDVIQLKGLENIIGTEFLATDVKIIRVVD